MAPVLRIVYHVPQSMISDFYPLTNVCASLSFMMTVVNNYVNPVTKPVKNATDHYNQIVCLAKFPIIEN